MEGVVILNQFEYVVRHTWGWDNVCTLSVMIAAAGIFGIIFWWYKHKKIDKASICWTVLFLVMTTFFSATAKDITEARYEVYLPAEVNMSEFTEKYRIVEQRGWIYTVVENEIQVIEEG